MFTPEVSGLERHLNLFESFPPNMQRSQTASSPQVTPGNKASDASSGVSWCTGSFIQSCKENSVLSIVPGPAKEYPLWAARGRQFVSTAVPLTEHQAPKEHHSTLAHPELCSRDSPELHKPTHSAGSAQHSRNNVPLHVFVLRALRNSNWTLMWICSRAFVCETALSSPN